MIPYQVIQLAKPRLGLYFVILGVILGITLPLFTPQSTAAGKALSAYLSVVWTLPVLSAVLIVAGAVLAYRDMSRKPQASVVCNSLLVVQLPTVGRHDVLPALTRVVRSFEHYLPTNFTNWRVDVISEEGAPAIKEMQALCGSNVRLVLVPKGYQTVNGAIRKSRANCYADWLRGQEGEAGADTWVLHMDDDTSIGPDTAAAVARIIVDNPQHKAGTKHLAQGVLTYPRQHAASYWAWMADAIRPSGDMSMFRLMTGTGNPLVGAHGELLLVRSSIEHQIGWDFGRNLSITEDANFALNFGRMFPGRSMWFAARCYGASPSSMKDLVTQRTRWSRGLLHVVVNRRLPLRRRVLLGYLMTTWILGPFQHVGLVLLLAFLLGSMNTSPMTRFIVVLWGLFLASQVWSYMEGLRHNAHASGMLRPRKQDWASLLLMPFFSLVEGWAGLRGGLQFVGDKTGWYNGEPFQVIRKGR